ncbi:MAG: inositol monophosphatase [Acetobacteraceae bacterium]|nr:inositol monophosphatase [Acetobacteraceae bacterium]
MTLCHADARRIAAILRQAAAAEIMPRWRRLAAGDVRSKTGPLDPVTDADEGAERLIAAALAAAYPGCAIVGEEEASADPSILRRLKGADLAFVIDPVDGTANFAAGLPLFGCMAAAVVHGEVVLSVIHDPLGDDSAIALRGEGAWTLAADGRETALGVAAPVPLAEMSGCASWRYLDNPLRTRIHHRLDRVAASMQYRCAAHEYRLVAGGHCHYLLYGRLHPWDHAPGWLLHREAGGYSARFDASAYDPTDSGGGLICAPDEASWHALHTALIA